jgi:hypothetical protein
VEEEERQLDELNAMQDEIHNTYIQVPKPPTIQLKRATQTSLLIRWDPFVLASATFRGVDVYRNGQKLGLAPNASSVTCKLSGLDVAHEYQIWIVLRTSAGKYESNHLVCKTHALDNLTGLFPSFGSFNSDDDIETLTELIERIGASFSEDLGPENTHLICTVSTGPKYERAVELNIPIVTPEFLKACEQQKKVLPAHSYYLPK